MDLYIAEKPELAKAIVAALGGGERNDGYYQCGYFCPSPDMVKFGDGQK